MRRTTSSGGWNLRRVSDPEGQLPDPTTWVCPLPLRETKRIVMGHGGGGILSEELIENLFYLHSDRRVVRRATPRYSTLTAGASP